MDRLPSTSGAPAAASRSRHLVVGGVALAIGVAAGWLAHGTLRPPPPAPPPLPTAVLDSLDASLARVRGRLTRVDPPTSGEESALRRPQTPSYTDHLEMADSLGVDPVDGETELDALVRAGRLVPLVDSPLYAVRVLEHSKPFVTPATRRWLDAMGTRFRDATDRAGLPPYRPVVSSALRTADLQRDLRRSNRNATSGRSSHEYGVSIDFDYSDYRLAPSGADSLRIVAADTQRELAQRLADAGTDDLGRAYWVHLYGLLARVLAEEQRAERALVLLEDAQPVFHVTVTLPS